MKNQLYCQQMAWEPDPIENPAASRNPVEEGKVLPDHKEILAKSISLYREYSPQQLRRIQRLKTKFENNQWRHVNQ